MEFNEILTLIGKIKNPIIEVVVILTILGFQVYTLYINRKSKKENKTLEENILNKTKDILIASDMFRISMNISDNDLIERQLNYTEIKLKEFIENSGKKIIEILPLKTQCAECPIGKNLVRMAFDNYWNNHVNDIIKNIKNILKLWIPINNTVNVKLSIVEETILSISNKIFSYSEETNFKNTFGKELEEVINKKDLQTIIKEVFYKTSDMFNEELENKNSILKKHEENIRSILK